MKLLDKIFANRVSTSLYLVAAASAVTALLSLLFLAIDGDLSWASFKTAYLLCTAAFVMPIYIGAILNLIPVFKDPDFWWPAGFYYGGGAAAVFCHKYLHWPDADALLAGFIGAAVVCQLIWRAGKAAAKRQEEERHRRRLEKENEELKKRISELTGGDEP